MLNPGTLPVPDTTATHADANIAALVADLAGHDLTVEAVRDEQADQDGRYGYVLTAGGATVTVLMPGVPLALVRDNLGSDAPCLYVGGEPWWWPSAVQQVAGALR